MKKTILFLLTLISINATAGLRMFAWEPGTTLAPLVMFAKDTESNEAAIGRYLGELSRDPGLVEIFHGVPPELPSGRSQNLSENEINFSALLIANNSYDFTVLSKRLNQFKSVFLKNKTKILILPMNADLGLGLSEKRELRDIIAEKFPLLVAMGGEDVDPELYGKQSTFSKNTILSRDRFEISLIQSYVKKAKGFLLGICRGHQISSVALGYQLIQDISNLTFSEKDHTNSEHSLKVLPTTNSILSSAISNFSEQMRAPVRVNSFHHQAVRYRPGGPLELAAIGEDGIVEALEFKNGKGLLVQFHPESMNDSVGSAIIGKVIEAKAKSIQLKRKCSVVFAD